VSASTFTGAQIAGLVNAGADEPVMVSLNAAIDGVDTGLDSKGSDILFEYVDATHVTGVTADARTYPQRPVVLARTGREKPSPL
jgi:hypothetical protein